MAQLAEIQSAQRSLEDCFTKKMDELQAQLQSGGPAKDTVAKVADEFRTFRELVYKMLAILRKQIAECSKSIDALEARSRRNTLIFTGIAEAENENCTSTILKLLASKLEWTNKTDCLIKVCHRIGSFKKGHNRPILVKLSSTEIKAAVWKSKTKLKCTGISIKESLTKARQSVFSAARQHFGMRGCWTQDGTIVIKIPDGSRLKITTKEELEPLLMKYPKTSTSMPSKNITQ